MNISSLLNQIRDGEVVLPAIQRNFVWSEDKIRRLLDSIMRGYPIGIALLWDTYLDLQHRAFAKDFHGGTLVTFRDNTSQRRLKLVLDGQQRLQSLYIALYGSYEGRFLYFDVLSGCGETNGLDGERFHFKFSTLDEVAAWHEGVEKKLANPLPIDDDRASCICHWVKVSQLFEMDSLSKVRLKDEIANRLSLTQDEKARLDLNLDTLRQVLSQDENILKVSTVDENLAPSSASRKTEADILEIFVRINREGTQLSRSDLIFSMLKLNWKHSADVLPKFLADINTGNSFALDADFVILCLLAVSDLGAKFDLNILRNKSNVDSIKRNFDRCCDAIRSTVDFVRTQCNCQSSALIGNEATLIPFVYYLFHTPNHEVPNDLVQAVRKAFFLLALSKPFSRYAESRVSSYIRTYLQPLAATHQWDFPLRHTVQQVKNWERSVQGYDVTLLQANHLLVHHLVQGQVGGDAKYLPNSPQLDHIFPRSVLRKRNFDESSVNHVANLWILAQGKNQNKSNRPPDQYFADVDSSILRAAAIDRRLLSYERFPKFLQVRTEKLLDRLSEITGLCREDFINEDSPGASQV